MAKDETEEGITGLPIPKKKMSPKKRHKFEQKRREERKKRGDDRVGDTFSQHRMTGSRGRGSEYEVNPRVSYRHNEQYLIGYLLDEGFASDEKSAKAIANVMGEEWKQSILEMDEFSAGGGNAKMKKTGMTKDQVIAIGKKNLASKSVTSPKPSSSIPQSSKSVSGSTPSDAVIKRLNDREAYRSRVTDAMAQGTSPVGLRRRELARDQEAKFDDYRRKQDQSGYYKIKSFKDIPG